MQVGIRVYKIQIYKDHKTVTSATGGGPRDIQSAVRGLIKAYTKKSLVRTSATDDGNEGEKRSHRFLPEKDDVFSQHGIIRYGTFGYGTDVEHVDTGIVSHTRTLDEADTIPLYHRFWWPDGYSYGLWAFQSFSGRSCATTILSEFRSVYRESFPDWRAEAKKIVHDEIAEFQKKRVKKITLVKPKASGGTVAQALQPSSLHTEVDISLEVKARGSGAFGKLGDLKEKLSGKIKIGDIDYTRAYATVTVNGKDKKIGVIGVSSTTGVIDVTSEVDFDNTTMMPTLKSISKVTKGEIADFAKKLKQ